MALFKIFKGKSADLPTSYHDGYCYVTTDGHKMYIDSSDKAAGRFALNAANADSADKLNSSAGSTTKPIYFSGGKPVALSNTIGANNKPIFLSGGNITASTLTLGSGTQPIYMSSGTMTASTSTVGSATLPVYLKSGVITACTAGSVLSGLDWEAGTTAGPMISITVAGQNRKAAIPSASDEASGIVTTDKQTFAGAKTFAGTLTVSGATTVNSSITATGTVTAPTFSGALSGNAATASKWATARTLSWTGDATGSMSVDGSANKSAALTLANSGVTAGSYGPSSNSSPGVSGSFSVPYFTVDAKGRITAASTKTITLPSDTKVTNTLGTTTKAYITGTTSSTTNTGTQIFDTGVYLSTTAGELVATKFTGSLNGNANTATSATTATYLGSSTVGSSTKFIYLSGGSPVVSSSTVGAANKPVYMSSGAIAACSSTVGSASVPVYMNGGTITQCTASSLFSSFYWNNGTSSGPSLSTTVAGQTRSAQIPSASASYAGVVTTGTQTFAGAKTFNSAALFAGGLKVGTSSESVSITYDTSSDTLSITFP